VDGQKSVKEEYYVLTGLGSCGEQRERGCPVGSWNKNTHLFFYFGHYLGVKMVLIFVLCFCFGLVRRSHMAPLELLPKRRRKVLLAITT